VSWAEERKALTAEAKRKAEARGHTLGRMDHRKWYSAYTCTICLDTVYAELGKGIHGAAVERDCTRE
jgi:hypothetical protein